MLLSKAEQEEKSKKSTVSFYKDFFYFIALSVRINENLNYDNLALDKLWESVQRENVPYHLWYQWIPAKIHRTLYAASRNSTSSSQETIPVIQDLGCVRCKETLDPNGKVLKDSRGRLWHDKCFRCSLCKNRFQGGKTYFFEARPEKQFCLSCYDKLEDMIQKKIITPDLDKKSTRTNSPTNF